MELNQIENIHYGFDDGVSGSDAGHCGRYVTTSTPQATRRPLQQLNTPVSTPVNTGSQSLITPYKYHRCQVIPEEREDQENVDPRRKERASKASISSIKSQVPSSEENSNDDSSPFAYPLIWEPHHTASPSSHSPSGLKKPSSDDGGVYQSPTNQPTVRGKIFGTSSQKRDGDCTGQEDAHENHSSDVSLEKDGKRREKVRNKSGPNGSENSSGWNPSHCCTGLTVTPSKSSSTPSPSSRSVFRTPSERFSTAKLGESRGGQTPQRWRVNSSHHHHSINPFEVGAECLQLPTVSPSLFRQAVSPCKGDYPKFRWSIDQLAELQPANIETSPFNQQDVLTDPDYERQAQDAINKFFTHHSVVPSPWTGSNKSVNLLKMVSTPLQSTASHLPSHTNTVWCQTELTLPPVLPAAVEEVLKPFCNFTQDQWWQGSGEGEEGAASHNTTLRRKLLFSQEELLNATPMCSPRGADTDDDGSPPSSPGVPLPLHEDDDNSKGLKDETDEGLLWCTAVMGPRSLCMTSSEPHLSRIPPPTPPASSACVPVPLSMGVLNRPESSCTVTSPGVLSVSSVKSFSPPDMSPIKGPACVIVAANSKFFISPEVSPIHIQQYSSSSELRKCSSSSSPYNQVLPSDAVSKSRASPNTSPVYLSANTTCSATREKRNSPGSGFDSPRNDTRHQQVLEDCTTTSRFSPHYHLGTTKCSPSHYPHSCSPVQLRTETKMIVECQSDGFPNKITVHAKSKSPNHSISLALSPCEGPVEKSTGPEKDFQVKTSEGPGICEGTEKHKSDKRIEDLAARNCAVQLPDHVCECLGIHPHSNQQRMDNLLDTTQGFSLSEHKDVENQETSGRSSPLEHRTSSNSGHFSSSPIRDIRRSPLETDTPNRRFSASPPLSPILCRSLVLPPQHKTRRQSPPQHHLKARQLSLSQTTHTSDVGGGSCMEEVMMEDDIPQADSAASSMCRSQAITICDQPSATMLLPSSVCDMDTESRPSLEINGSNEGQLLDTGYLTGSLQDTGYQTGSLHSTNYSITACNQDTYFTNSAALPPPVQHKEHHHHHAFLSDHNI